MWHRVDYDVWGDALYRGGYKETSSPTNKSDPNDVLSLGASVFHFYPKLFVTNLPLFAFLIIPNLVWEALGLNME